MTAAVDGPDPAAPPHAAEGRTRPTEGQGRVPAPPGLRASARRAALGLAEQAPALVAANIVWGVVALMVWLGLSVAPPAGLMLAVVLAWPTAAVGTLAGRMVRGEQVVLRDAFRWSRRTAVPLLWAGVLVGGVVAWADLQLGLEVGGPVGVVLATAAGWGLVGLVVLGCCVWPLLGDPMRADRSAGGLVRLGVGVAFLAPGRTAGLAIVCLVGVVLSAILAAALLTVSVAFLALLCAHVVLPLADRVDPVEVAPTD